MDTQSDNQTRQGLTLEYLADKRAGIAASLRSAGHADDTETKAYGSHDPLDVPLWCCQVCGVTPREERIEGKHLRWRYICQTCGRGAKEARKRPWLAALAWNEINLQGHSYRDLPLFGLNRHSPVEAQQRMVGIRHDLELRRKLAGLDRRTGRHLGRRTPGRLYLLRLDAYLKWAMLALRLIKAETGALHPTRHGQ